MTAKEEVQSAAARLRGLGFVAGRDKAFALGAAEAVAAIQRALDAWPAAAALPTDLERSRWIFECAVKALAEADARPPEALPILAGALLSIRDWSAELLGAEAPAAAAEAFAEASPAAELETAAFLVFGPPGSGKTAWVEARRQPGDLVWDFDAMAATMTQLPSYPRPPHVSSVLMALRGTLVDWLRGTKRRAFIITTEREEAERLAQQLGSLARLISERDRAGDAPSPLLNPEDARGFA